MLRKFLFGIFAALMSMAMTASAQDDGTAESGDYLLNAGDVVEISVLEDSSLNRQVLVRPDGKVSMPLAGTVVAEGRTPEDLQEAVQQALAKDFLEPPTVTVSLVSSATTAAEMDTHKIYVIGQVPSPGRIEVLEPIDVLQALAIAGGPGLFAAKHRIQIRRRNETGGETVSLFDYTAVEDGNGIALHMVSDGDVVVVPERGLFE